jgi:branched-chain amino acid transport system substrate-binding protein
MKTIKIRLLLAALLLTGSVLCLQQLEAQGYHEKEGGGNYGNTPSDLLPYEHYQEAYIYHFHVCQPFTGAGREKKEPTDLTDVRIGVLAPLEGDWLSPQGNQLLHGAMLAAEEANARGGYKGLPFTVMPHNDVGLWGAAANEVVKMYDEGAWAILGTIDDVNSHVAIRVALKLEIPVVNCGDPDPTFTETNIPWVIRVIGDDRQSSYALVEYIHQKMKHKRVAVLRANNRYGRVGVMEFRDAALRMGYPLVLEIRYDQGDTDFSKQIEHIRHSKPDAILLWGNANEMAMMVNQIRDMGLTQPIYASDRSVNPLFLEIAGENANGIITTCQYNPKADLPQLKAFQAHFKERFGMEPDVFAAHAYDGTNLIIQAIEKTGLNKARIRDLLTDRETFQGYVGVTGPIILDPSWNDVGPIWMAEIKDGDYIFSPATWKWKD